MNTSSDTPARISTSSCPRCYSTNIIHTWRVDMDVLRTLDETICGECGMRTLEWSD